MLEPPKKPSHVHDPFCGHYTPAAIRWWCVWIKRHYRHDEPEDYGHHDVLLKMIRGNATASDAEGLAHCYHRVVNEGARSSSGLWCVCLTEDAPATVDARGYGGGDGKAALIAVDVDLQKAADQLPIGWTSTQHIFETQGRERVYRQRLGYYRRNLGVREADRWLEPRDPETRRPASRALAHFMMAVFLGHPTSCRWPRAGSLIERDVFTTLAHGLKEAA